MDDQHKYSQVPDGSVKELLRQAELCLQGTVQVAIALDQRATTLAGVLTGGAVALLVAAGSMISSAAPFGPLIAACVCASVTLFAGAVLCAIAARPVDFHLTGYEPDLLAISASDEFWMQRYTAEDLQRRIDANRAALESAAALFTRGRALAVLASPLAAVTYVIAAYSPLIRFF